MIGLWFGDHGNVGQSSLCFVQADIQALRFYGTPPNLVYSDLTVLFIGMMNLFYVVWDYIDEKLFDKRNTSDCAQFSELLGYPTASECSYTSVCGLTDRLGYILVRIRSSGLYRCHFRRDHRLSGTFSALIED